MRRRRGVTVTRQHHDWDCGVASLAMLLGAPYGDVAAQVRDLCDKGKLRKRGMAIADMQLVAACFGVALEPVWRKKDYLVGRTGVLGLIGGDMDRAGHWVVLKSGPSGMFIVDPDGGESWDALDYMAKHKARPTVLMVEA